MVTPFSIQCDYGGGLSEQVGQLADPHVEAMTAALYLADGMPWIEFIDDSGGFFRGNGTRKTCKQPAYVPTSSQAPANSSKLNSPWRYWSASSER